jgi:hypothetical protein
VQSPTTDTVPEPETVAEVLNKADFEDVEGLAARMLLAVFDFLADGDVTAFSVDDREDWINTVLNSAAAELEAKARRKREKALLRERMIANMMSSIASMAKKPLQSQFLSPSPPTVESQQPHQPEPDAVTDALASVGRKTWREAVMALQDQVPIPRLKGYSEPINMQIAADATKGKLYDRILEMHNQLADVMKRQILKHSKVSRQKKLPATSSGIGNLRKIKSSGGRMLGGALDEDDEVADDADFDAERDELTPVNVYVGNLKVMLHPRQPKLAEDEGDEDD